MTPIIKLLLFLLFLAPLLAAQTAPRAIITWEHIPDGRVAGYKVKRGTSPTAITAATAVPDVSLWQDATIEPTLKYWYAVSGIDTDGLEGETGIADNNPFRFSDIQPASPANLVCSKTKTGSTVRLQCYWSQVTKTRSLLLLPTGASVSYRVFLSSTGGTVKTFPVLSGTSISISDVKRHQTFYVFVLAVWNGIESLGSPAVRIQT